MQNNVLDYLNDIVRVKPDKTAFADPRRVMTFAQVYGQSRAIATFLHRKGIEKQPVVVFMGKSPEEITAFFGVIAAGNFYVPIDEEMPSVRIDLILENVKAGMLICDASTEQAARQLRFQGEIVLYEDACGGDVDEEALQKIYDRAIDTDPVYIVFTSGSTGVPKGVAACHRSVIDYIEQLSEVMGFDENTVFGNQTPLYFDACLKELYPTLKFGATTWLIPRELFTLPVKLVEFLNEHKINTICWVVSALTMVSAFETFRTVTPQYLRNIAFGSEVFPLKQFRKWREALPQAKFTNLYGPTEGTGMCCYYRVERELQDGEPIPIGRPFKNTEILLLNEKDERAAAGEEGEICIRGTSLTLGYYNDFERTRQAFVQNPLNTAYPEMIYRTGDIGRLNEQGELVFVSRKDYQIKHMGHRSELGEIEADAARIDVVTTCCCLYIKENNKIVLFYMGDTDKKQLTAALKERLPRYMLPNAIMQTDRLPLTANGKMDRQKMQELYMEQRKKRRVKNK